MTWFVIIHAITFSIRSKTIYCVQRIVICFLISSGIEIIVSLYKCPPIDRWNCKSIATDITNHADVMMEEINAIPITLINIFFVFIRFLFTIMNDKKMIDKNI